MWNPFRPQPRPAALDVTADGIRMMQLAPDGNGLRLQASARRMFRRNEPLTAGRRSDEIRRAVDAGDFTTNRVITALPREIVHLRTVRLPVVEAGEIESLIRNDADCLFPFDLAGADLQCRSAGVVRQGGQERLEIIAAAARHDDVAAFLGELKSAGLQAVSLQLAPFAALHCARRGLRVDSADDAPEVCALVEVGASATTVIVSRGENPLFIKQFDIGARHLNDAVTKKLGLDLAEVSQLRRRLAGANPPGEESNEKAAGAVHASIRGLLEQLAHDVDSCFRYVGVTFRGKRPSRIALLGDEAADPRVQDALAAAAPGKLEVIDPLAGIDLTAMRIRDRNVASGEWTTCVGLLLDRSGSFAPLCSRETQPTLSRCTSAQSA